MARPIKDGLSYFPMDVDMDYDDKIQIIEGLHGAIGFASVIKTLMKIYSNGYFYDWTDQEKILSSKRIGIDINSLNNIINDCIKYELFNEKLFNEYSILTSSGIQKRYFNAVGKRKKGSVIKEYLLIELEELNELCPLMKVETIIHEITTNEDGVIHGITTPSEDVIQGFGTQTKLNKTKLNKTKQHHKETETKQDAAPNAHQFYQENFGMENPTTMQTIEFWIEDLNEDLVIEAMRRAAIDQKGFRYAEGIMKNWDKKNIRTMEQVEAEDVSFNNRKQNNNNFGKNQKVEQFPAWANEPQPTEEKEIDDEIQQEFLDRLQRFREGNPN